jgi:hypothetical protein
MPCTSVAWHVGIAGTAERKRETAAAMPMTVARLPQSPKAAASPTPPHNPPTTRAHNSTQSGRRQRHAEGRMSQQREHKELMEGG